VFIKGIVSPMFLVDILVFMSLVKGYKQEVSAVNGVVEHAGTTSGGKHEQTGRQVQTTAVAAAAMVAATAATAMMTAAATTMAAAATAMVVAMAATAGRQYEQGQGQIQVGVVA
jgi:hypothetical protein